MSKVELSLEDGKYTVISDRGHLTALRHGEPWRDMTGDKLIGCMVSEIESLREELARLREGVSGESATLESELSKVTQLRQRQDGVTDQLRDLRPFANRLGLYDAADLLRTLCEAQTSKEKATYQLATALMRATEAGVLDDMADGTNPEVVNAFCNQFDALLKRDRIKSVESGG